jgi:HK97 family phage prohead protease
MTDRSRDDQGRFLPDAVYPDEEMALEVRDFERREIVARLLPYNEPILVRGRPESFVRGAVAGIDPTSIKLLSFHDQRRPIGKSVELEERDDGAYVRFRISKTTEGDEMLELANDGVLSISPGFIPGVQNQQGVHQRLKALPEASLVTFAAYSGAKVLSVREKEAAMADNKPTTEPVEEPAVQTVDLGPIETRLKDLSTQIETLQSVVDAPARNLPAGGPTPFDWFMAQMEERLQPRSMQYREALDEKWENFQTRAKEGTLQTRALADITGGQTQAGDNDPADDLSGLVVEEYLASQLVSILDRRRPLFASFGSFPSPRSGYARIPVVTQHVTVAARTAQKTEPTSQKMILKTEPFEAKWLDGALDVAIEVTQMAELPVMEIVWEDLRGAYAAATEHDVTNGAVPWFEAGALGFTYTGTALDTATYAGFIADVEEQIDTIEDAAGEPPSVLAVTRAQWRVLVAMVDANDRRLFSTINPQNADASVGLTARSFSLPGGIEVFKVKGLTQAALYGPSALRATDYGPSRVEATNVALMGRDIGILGRTMLVNRIPAGVVVFGTEPS